MALIERETVWELVGDIAATVHPGSKLEGVISRYASAIDNAPVVDAIPVSWIENVLKEWLKGGASFETLGAISAMLVRWQKEQETQDV